MKLIEARSIYTGYRHGFRRTVTVSKNLSTSISSGEVVGLIGPNGCGKSTLLRSLGGLQPVLDGNVYIGETEISHMSPLERARKISVVLTERVHTGHLKADTIVSLGRYPHTRLSGGLTTQDRLVVERSFSAVGAELLRYRTIDELSDGELQKVMVARALAQEPQIIMMDEPTAYLDVTRKVELMELLERIARTQGTAVLVSSHDLDLLMRISSRVLLMDEFGMLHEGAPQEDEFRSLIRKVFHIPAYYVSF
ncbi:MAG: ABC transporter ATP-binding protein [Spirochaetia bacterium]